MFGYPCPSCDQRLSASPDRVGQRTICPKCLKPIVIPGPDAGSSAVEPDLPPPPVQVDPPITYDVDGDAESALRADEAAQQTPLPNGAWQPARAAAAVADLTDPDFDPDALPAPARPPEPPPAPRPASPPAARPAPVRPGPAPVADRAAAGMVVFNPTAVESLDIAAELTAALSLRMKPPPEPPSDLRVSTGAWLLLTAVGGSLWLFSVMNKPVFGYVALIGAVQIVAGYAWVVYHAWKRDPRQGRAALLPHVGLEKMAHPPVSIGYRPLRFAATGLLLLALAAVGPAVRPVAQNVLGLTDGPPPRLPEVAETPMLRIKEAEQQKSMQPLVDVLRELAQPAAILSAPADEKPALVDKFKQLARSDRGEVRAAALAALVTWSPDDARAEVLAALHADSPEKARKAGIELADRWKDPRVAAAVAARLGDREEGPDAMQALKRIGGPVAEDAVLPLLESDDYTVRQNALEVLQEVGRERAVAVLTAMAAKRKSDDARRPLTALANKIRARIGGKD